MDSNDEMLVQLCMEEESTAAVRRQQLLILTSFLRVHRPFVAIVFNFTCTKKTEMQVFMFNFRQKWLCICEQGEELPTTHDLIYIIIQIISSVFMLNYCINNLM
jgi:hypothetical protein